MMLCLSGSELGLRFVVLICWLRSLFMYDSMVGFICIYIIWFLLSSYLHFLFLNLFTVRYAFLLLPVVPNRRHCYFDCCTIITSCGKNSY